MATLSRKPVFTPSHVVIHADFHHKTGRFYSRFAGLLGPVVMVSIGVFLGLWWENDSFSLAQAQEQATRLPPTETAAASQQPALGAIPGGSGLREPVQVIQAREGRDVAGSGDLIGFSHVNDQGTQVISLVNVRKLWMAVYHIGSEGAIRLVSSRAIDADFSLQLNATEPLPDQIRRLQGK